ncbi:ferritin-like domain-containing protein [Sphingomonas bacterium]|uniref:ferritin-like domain-containing protein n=1 Tax=Sphingomonas bacterium TaxID=1895847 RepID=UPI001575A7E2|nr:ferritin-like domain-containing protein [Sphingomonas bacterium]
MLQNETILALVERSEKRRTERRSFLKAAGAASAATVGLAVLSACGGDKDYGNPTPAATSTTLGDADVLNFALNLEYLEATFYSYAAFGTPLSVSSTGGVGTTGTVTGGRQVNFTDPVVAQYAREIALDEINHVNFLRSQLAGSSVALPSLNIDGGATGAFTAAARAAGVVSATGTFDPYASDENFLLGAFIFEDVGVTAYKGASPLIANKTYLEAAAGILAVEAYHAGLIRTILYTKGMNATPSLITNAGLISDARDSLDGASDDDQGIAMSGGASNIVPTDTNGITYSRSTGQVLNVVYLNKASVSSGGFFPAGVNGAIKTSAAN